MTYDEIVAWAKEAYQIEFAGESYSDWLSAVESDFDSQGHFFPEQCYRLMENAWNDAQPRERHVMPLEAYNQDEPLKTRVAYRLEFRKPSESFTPIELSRNLKLNPNTTRRLVQELRRDGVLERTSRGHYRYVSGR